MTFQVVKKLTVKTVFGKVSVRDIPKDGQLFIASFFGRCVATKPITTAIGDSLALHGDFRAINGKGEQFASMVCYLPPVCTNYIAAALKPGTPLEFAFKVSVADNPSSPVGYEYIAEPIPVTQDRTDPLAHLIEAVTGEKAPQLPAPATARDKADEKKHYAKGAKK